MHHTEVSEDRRRLLDEPSGGRVGAVSQGESPQAERPLEAVDVTPGEVGLEQGLRFAGIPSLEQHDRLTAQGP